MTGYSRMAKIPSTGSILAPPGPSLYYRNSVSKYTHHIYEDTCEAIDRHDSEAYP